MNPWRRLKIWILIADLRREHRALVRSFEKDYSGEGLLASVCTCMPGDDEDWPTWPHAPGCRTWLV